MDDEGMVTDEHLMLAYCEGDERAFEQLYVRHKERVYFFIRRFVPREDLVEEVYHEAFVRLHKSRHRYQPTAKFSTFLYTIVYRLCVDLSRSKGWRDIENRSRPDDRQPDPSEHRPGPEHEAYREEKQRVLRAALEKLPKRRRAAVLLHDLYGYTAREVSETMDCTAAAAKMTIFRGRRQLREILSADPVAEEMTG